MNEKIKSNITTKVNEATVYRAMGLPKEALHVYQQILMETLGLPPQVRDKIRERILLLRKEISDQDRVDGQKISQEDINLFRETVDVNGSVQGILDKARAFQEIGLYEEALVEYRRLFDMKYPTKKIVAKISGCLLAFHSPVDTVHEVLKIVCEKRRH